MAEIGSKIKYLRVKRGFTQEELANILGLKKAHVSNWENNKNHPSKENLNSLATALGVEVMELFNENITRAGESEMPGYYVKDQPGAQRVELDQIEIPIVEVKAQAGYLAGYQDPEYMESLPKISVSRDLERNGNFIAWRIGGDSMNDGTVRSLLNDDVWASRELDKIHWQNKLYYKQYIFVIVSEDEGVTVKQIVDHDVANGIITCHAFNPLWKDFKVNLAQVKQLFYLYRLVDRRPQPF